MLPPCILVVVPSLEVALEPSSARDRQIGARQYVGDALHFARPDQPQAVRQSRRQYRAGGDALPMQPLPEPESGFDRVAESMAVIEQSAYPVFALIESHDFGLDGAGALDRVRQRFRILLTRRGDIASSQSKNARSRSARI